MRHLLNPLDFSVEEIDDLLALARDIEKIFPDMRTFATAKSLLPCFMSPAPEHA